MHRYPSKSNALAFLKEAGVRFGTIVDVGAHAETPELRAAFPDNRHILFEPTSEFFPKIAQNYAGLNYELAPVAVSDTDGVSRLKKMSVGGDEVSHASLASSEEKDTVSIETVRLDTFFSKRSEPKPYFVKIDVDGFEMPILRGAEGIWQDIDCIVIEAPKDSFLERFQYIASRGFHLFDMVDHCYYGGVFHQVDLVFISDRLRSSNIKLRPLDEPFEWSKWLPVANYEYFLPKS